jgi:hypothetical protein
VPLLVFWCDIRNKAKKQGKRKSPYFSQHRTSGGLMIKNIYKTICAIAGVTMLGFGACEIIFNKNLVEGLHCLAIGCFLMGASSYD